MKVVIVEGYKKISEHLLGKEKENLKRIKSHIRDRNSQRRRNNKGSDALLKEGKTTAPKRFTEDTLCAMERQAQNISKEVREKVLNSCNQSRNLIEKLVHIGFIERQGEEEKISSTHR